MGAAKMQSLAFFLLVAAGDAQTYFNSNAYFQTAGGVSSCGTGYQVITDEKACKEVAGQISGKDFGSIYHYYPVNPFTNYCTSRSANDVNYYVNPEGVLTDVSVSVLCIKSSLECDVTNGSAVSSSYPCTCGTDTCSTGEVCNATSDLCEVIEGYYETERKANSCPIGYQVITDQAACQEVAAKISGRSWGAVYDFTTVPHGCSSWTTSVVNYYVNPGGPVNVDPQGTNTDVDVAMLCIKSSMACDVTDGSGNSSSYPCTCGTDTCATGEVCRASANICEVIKGYYETERRALSCPTNYQVITDEAACREVAGQISSKSWGAVYSFTTLVHGCVTHLADTVDYYVNPGGPGNNSDSEVALLCIRTSFLCDVSDGSGVSGSYPCTCGTDTCATGQICRASENLCEVIPGYYETERKANSCPSGYQVITDEAACRQVAGSLPGKAWGATYSFTTVVHGCVTRVVSDNLADTVDYYVNPGSVTNTDVNVALLCIRSDQNCSVDDGSNVSSSYPCTCGTDTCADNEVCRAASNLCEVIQDYYETERKASSCPSGYQAITDAAACREVAGSIAGKAWGGAYGLSTIAHGCGTNLADTVNYYVNPGGTNTDVNVAMLCISSSLKCSVTDGTGVSSSYPCTCGTDTCGPNEVCRAADNICEIAKGYYQTERQESSCPTGYKSLTGEAACRQVATEINHSNWGAVFAYSTAAPGCGTWMFETVNYYVNPGGTNTDVDVAMLCVQQ